MLHECRFGVLYLMLLYVHFVFVFKRWMKSQPSMGSYIFFPIQQTGYINPWLSLIQPSLLYYLLVTANLISQLYLRVTSRNRRLGCVHPDVCGRFFVCIPPQLVGRLDFLPGHYLVQMFGVYGNTLVWKLSHMLSGAVDSVLAPNIETTQI